MPRLQKQLLGPAPRGLAATVRSFRKVEIPSTREFPTLHSFFKAVVVLLIGRGTSRQVTWPTRTPSCFVFLCQMLPSLTLRAPARLARCGHRRASPRTRAFRRFLFTRDPNNLHERTFCPLFILWFDSLNGGRGGFRRIPRNGAAFWSS